MTYETRLDNYFSSRINYSNMCQELDEQIVSTAESILGDTAEITSNGEAITVTPIANNPHGLAVQVRIFNAEDNSTVTTFRCDDNDDFNDAAEYLDIDSETAFDLLRHLIDSKILEPDIEHITGELLTYGGAA